MAHPLTVAIHQGDTTVTLPSDSLEAAYDLLRTMLELIRRDDCKAFGTIRSTPSGVLMLAMDTSGETWNEASVTPERLAVL